MQPNNTQQQLSQVITQVVNGWKAQSQAITTFIEKYSDDAYLQTIAPGRNRAIYIFGHLVSASDGLFPMFGLGNRLFPLLETVFTNNPDRTFEEIPSLASLKSNWATINKALEEQFAQMTTDDWLSRHTKVSAEDFATDPLRNKLNVLIGRTIHMGYHLGQLNLLTVTG